MFSQRKTYAEHNFDKNHKKILFDPPPRVVKIRTTTKKINGT